MIGMVTVTKDVAKQMIDNAPGDSVVIITINTKTLIHGKSKRKKKEDGKTLIELAEEISYQDNDYFGRMSLYGITEDKKMIHNILFPQLE